MPKTFITGSAQSVTDSVQRATSILKDRLEPQGRPKSEGRKNYGSNRGFAKSAPSSK